MKLNARFSSPRDSRQPSEIARTSPEQQRSLTAHSGVAFLLALVTLFAAAPWALSQAQPAQTTPPADAPAQAQPASATPAAQAAQAAQADSVQPSPSAPAPASGEITEEQLKRQLVGKPLFLRGGYLGDSLSFTEHGDPTSHPLKGSYTLSAVEIEKVRLTKHKLELEGARFGLHFVGGMSSDNPAQDTDRVKITPKKKVLKITIDREQVIKPKVPKQKTKGKNPAPSPQPAVASQQASPRAPEAESAQESSPEKETGVPEKESEQAADPTSVTTTTSPAHAAQVLREALDRVFTQGTTRDMDKQFEAQLPPFWKLYFQARAAGGDFQSHDPKVFRPSAVDQQAKLLTSIAPVSNEYAQAAGIAGQALYRAVIGPDGKAIEVAALRPIGFGLDENAVAAIEQATFRPAVKGGQPVAETIDLGVMFRIYSKLTGVAASEKAPEKAAEPVKPGPYSTKPQ